MKSTVNDLDSSLANHPGISVENQNVIQYFYNGECSFKHQILKVEISLTCLMMI